MTNGKEFGAAGDQGGVALANRPQGVSAAIPGNVVAYRDDLVQKYHGGAFGLIERLEKTGQVDILSLAMALIQEMVRESDHLLGNELVATQNGDLRDASVISYKRAEVLEKAIKAAQARMEFERESGIDLDSPSMMVVFRFFMSKVKDVFAKMGMDSEANDVFFRMLGDEMENWKRELHEKLEELHAGR